MEFTKSKIMDVLSNYLGERDTHEQRNILERILRRLKEAELYCDSHEIAGYDIEDILSQAVSNVSIF